MNVDLRRPPRVILGRSRQNCRQVHDAIDFLPFEDALHLGSITDVTLDLFAARVSGVIFGLRLIHRKHAITFTQ